MKAVLQKSKEAFCTVDGAITGKIDDGLVILLGITETDTEEDINYLCDKISNLRLFEDRDKHFEKSLLETEKKALVISQFTLYAGCKKGRRPEFSKAAKGETAEPIYEKFIEKLRSAGIQVETGVFGALMDITLTNQGPITIILDSNQK